MGQRGWLLTTSNPIIMQLLEQTGWHHENEMGEVTVEDLLLMKLLLLLLLFLLEDGYYPELIYLIGNQGSLTRALAQQSANRWSEDIQITWTAEVARSIYRYSNERRVCRHMDTTTYLTEKRVIVVCLPVQHGGITTSKSSVKADTSHHKRCEGNKCEPHRRRQ